MFIPGLSDGWNKLGEELQIHEMLTDNLVEAYDTAAVHAAFEHEEMRSARRPRSESSSWRG